ncbi:MAG: MerR family transcriptional regulator [Paracoccaceae bacterium]
MNKSPDAFRTISEVADLLETPAHVLRFWESRFPQIRPVKRAGGRRYYRPSDIALLTGIKRLLHDEGLTIRGVQKILREQGVRHVSGVPEDPMLEEDTILDAESVEGLAPPDGLPPYTVETAQVIALQTVLRDVPPIAGLPTAEAEAEDVSVEWDLADIPPAPDWTPPLPAAPPPPVMAAPEPAAPDGADLFSRLSSAPEPEPVAEAPMVVWADDTDRDGPPDLSQDTALPGVKVTRFGAAAPTVPPSAKYASPHPVPDVGGPTMAMRLRATQLSRLTSADRDRCAEIRDQAIALRQRLAASPRMPF